MRDDRGAARQDKRIAIAKEYLHPVPEGTLATPAERGFDTCPCPKECALHGSCLLCVAYHGRKSKLPRCER